MTDMAKIVSDAKASGYVPETVGKLLKLYNCPACGRKKVAMFRKDTDSVAACPCGFRRKSGATTPGPTGGYHCKAFTKKGHLCNNPAKYDGYCGVHRRK